MNCPAPCDKVRYSDRYRALLGSISIVMKGGPATTPYRAEACRCWHVTAHSKGKPRSGKLIKKVEAYRGNPETESPDSTKEEGIRS